MHRKYQNDNKMAGVSRRVIKKTVKFVHRYIWYIDCADLKLSDGQFEAQAGHPGNGRHPDKIPNDELREEVAKLVKRGGETGLALGFSNPDDLMQRSALLGEKSVSYVKLDVRGLIWRGLAQLRKRVKYSENSIFEDDVCVLFDPKFSSDRLKRVFVSERIPDKFYRDNVSSRKWKTETNHKVSRGLGE
ncbi:hypothetical protein BGZ63DRAFT_110387 [Mariannaea sp. PMI_226]|nr:hypothetical protein BGZ63DRAFT_110387 [Mariannaea sp. PMI_226]